MIDIRWVKLAVGMFNDPKLKIINSMEEKNLINYVWIRCLLLAGQSNRDGNLYINDNISYTLKTLSIEFDRTLDEIKSSINILRKLEMIEITEDKVFRVKNWDKHQNVDGLEKIRQQNCERVAKYRAKKKELKESQINNAENNQVDESQSSNSENIEVNETQMDDAKNIERLNNEKADGFLKNDSGNIEKNNIEDKKIRYLDSSLNSSNVNQKNIYDYSNVTCNDINNECTITVMEQNKRKNKIKKENKRDIEKNNYLGIHETENNTGLSNVDLSSAAINLLGYYEEITGLVGVIDVGTLRLAINTHGETNVKKAIERSIETGKTNMRYINGILKNWRKEGYPEDDKGGIKGGTKYSGKSSGRNSNEFKRIKPKKLRELTEEERENISTNLI